MTDESTTPNPRPEDHALAATLARIDARLERLEHSLAGVTGLAATAPGTLATAVDSIDGAIRRLDARGVDVDARGRRLLGLLESLTDPATVDALEQGLELLRNLPGAVATVADTLDSIIARLAGAGIDVDQRLQTVTQVAERLTAPEALAAVRELLAHVGAIQRLLESGIFAPGAVEVVDRASRALAEMDVAGARPVGAFGALRALGDPSIQRSLGALVEFGRLFGRTVHTRDGNGTG